VAQSDFTLTSSANSASDYAESRSVVISRRRAVARPERTLHQNDVRPASVFKADALELTDTREAKSLVEAERGQG
jgi:hypothetical protein